MADENNHFKKFVKSEINNVKDLAERNYNEHQTIFSTLVEIRIAVAKLEAKVAYGGKSRAAALGLYGSIGVAIIMSMTALIMHFS